MPRKRTPTSLSKKAGLRVFKLRHELGLSREKLASMSGLSTQTLKRLEKGQHVMLYCYEEIAIALKVPTSYLLGAALVSEETDLYSPTTYRFSRADIFRFLDEYRTEDNPKK